MSSLHNYFINLLSEEIFYYSGKSPSGKYVLFDKNDKLAILPDLTGFKKAPPECTGFNWVKPTPSKKLEIKYGGPIFTREIGSTFVYCDKIECSPDLYENLTQLVNSWSLEITNENKTLTIEPSNFLLVFCGSKYNVSKRQISEFLSDNEAKQ